MSRGARRLGVVLAAAVAVASACGGRGPSLERSVIVSRDRVDDALERITQARSQDELLERMDEAAALIDDVAAEADELKASPRRERALARLSESLRRLAFDLRATAEQIRQPGFGELVAGARGLSFESWDEVNAALAALRRTGIDVAPLARH